MGEYRYPRVDKTVVFSFNIPTLEHHCECTYMHAISVLLSYCLNFIQLYKNKVLTLQWVNRVKHVQFDVPLHLAVHSAYVRIFVYSVTSTGGLTQTLQMNIFSPKMFFFWGAMESKPAALPFHPLTQSDSADTTHSIHM